MNSLCISHSCDLTIIQELNASILDQSLEVLGKKTKSNIEKRSAEIS